MSKVSDLLQELPYGPAPEDAKLAESWLDEHGRTFGHFIGGRFTEPENVFTTLNPATCEEIAKVSQGSPRAVDQAVNEATAAFTIWSQLSGSERARHLYALARNIQKYSRLFAVLESMDNGKPIRETRDLDIPLVARHFYYHAGWARIQANELSNYEPVGVCGQIIPWNFPLLMLAWKIAPAIAMGNTVVLKPAEFTPLTALLFAEICEKSGLPPGVVNIVTGDGETGKAIVEHPDIKKIAFTGSTEVGKIIRKATAGTEKKLSLELGGKSPFLIFEDADLDSAVEGLVDAIWFNQGQVCCAGSRLLVHESIAELAFQKIRDRMNNLRVGNPLDKAIDIGAVVDSTQLERIRDLVEQGVREGAQRFEGSCPLPERGWFFPPTLLTQVEPSSTVAQVEIFGPVLVAMTFRTPAEAAQLANNTLFGLASSVWSQDLDKAHDLATQIKAGTVWINCTNQFDASTGFGGYRESGYGREGGKEGLYEYLKWKAPMIAKAVPPRRAEAPEASGIDRTHKLFIGGKQARPDGGYSFEHGGAEFARANRKDVRNAVEAARAAQGGWSSTTTFLRSQILYYLAENLDAASHQMVNALSCDGSVDAEAELRAAIDRVLFYAAWTDKYDGVLHSPPFRGMSYARPESIGVAAFTAPESPSLLGFLSAGLPLLAMGNTVIGLAHENAPHAAAELYRILEASDLPSGTFNILTGFASEVLPTLASHLDIDVLWHFGDSEQAPLVQSESTGNLKQTWCMTDAHFDWNAEPHPEFLRRASQVKNVWVPYGA